MKQLLFIFAVTLASCNTEPPPGVAFASLVTLPEPETKRAYNVGQTTQGVSAYYAESDVQFTLYFNQCAVIEMNGKTEHLDCEVYQTSLGVYVGDFGGGEFVKINTMTGTTTIYKGAVNRVYRKQQTP